MDSNRPVWHFLCVNALLLGLAGCVSQHDFTGVALPKQQLQNTGHSEHQTFLSARLSQKLIPLYEKDGHIATSGYIAQMLGLRKERIGNLSCYSQAPDDLALRYSAPTVGVWGLPLYTGYRHDIVNSLHSLHGGNAQAVADRRKMLEALVHQSFVSNQLDWQTGFLIHALGDSYAHVYFKNGQLQSYGEFIGHAFENTRWGERPDSIFVNGHSEIYLSYVSALFRALSPAGGASQERKDLLEAFQKRIREEAALGNKADKTAIYAMPTEAGSYIDIEHSDVNCEAAYSHLHSTEVRAFLRDLTLKLASRDK
jgi:hypothetical protein